MSKLDQEKIGRLNGLMNERWVREFSEIRSLLGSLDEEKQRVALMERAAEASDEALLEMLSTLDESLIQQNLQDVRDIVAARQRMEEGTYGECTDCGEGIAYERLLAYPTAKRCIDCQREHEQRKAAREGRAALR